MVRSALYRCVELACLLAVASAASPHCQGVVMYKSIKQAQEECVTYLRIPRARLAVYNEHIYPQDIETKCMVRCMGLNLGWWNDTVGVKESALRAYFHPDPDDCQHERRTYHCLKSQRLDSYAPQGLDPCERAYESFRCYYEQYGNIVVTPQFVPFSPLRMAAVMEDCAAIMHLPKTVGGCSRKDAAGSLHATRDVGCFLRCVFLRSGLYSEQYGPNLDRIYVQGHGYYNATRFRDNTMACYNHLKSTCLDECDLIYRFVNECFPEGGVNLSLLLGVTIARSLLGALGALGSLLGTVGSVLGTAGGVASTVGSIAGAVGSIAGGAVGGVGGTAGGAVGGVGGTVGGVAGTAGGVLGGVAGTAGGVLGTVTGLGSLV
ncbi:general odorant-binding protein 45-like [Anopheles ziemanni]|uniref:general odorant-binding protein 45-like n=1 Tax=Anopheles coustani TaxID=139045 RepID=UPI00265A492D|nr:general odorant-binding protein 45-like [Anopheles coustani]XP_058175680.1 general odorant-binding protein 45-like [Anopheles ziemanni]